MEDGKTEIEKKPETKPSPVGPFHVSKSPILASSLSPLTSPVGLMLMHLIQFTFPLNLTSFIHANSLSPLTLPI